MSCFSFTSTMYHTVSMTRSLVLLVFYYNPLSIDNKSKGWDLILLTSFIVVTFIKPNSIKKVLLFLKKPTKQKKLHLEYCSTCPVVFRQHKSFQLKNNLQSSEAQKKNQTAIHLSFLFKQQNIWSSITQCI